MPALITDANAPRSIMSLADARARVRSDLGLTDSSLLTNADLDDWLNEAQDLIALHTRWYRTFDTLGTTLGTKEYALPLPTAGRCIQIEEVRYDNRQLTVITLEELFLYDWNYQQSGNGTPDWYYLRGSGGFGLHLTPDVTDPDILTVLFVARPPQISATDDHFYIPHGCEYALLIYAKKLASEKDIHGEGARRVPMYEAQWQKALVDIKRQVDQVAERQPTVVGEQALDRGVFRRVPWHTTITSP